MVEQLNAVLQLVESIAFLVVVVAGVVAAGSVKASSVAGRVAAAAEAAVRAVEQWRIMRLKANPGNDVSAAVLREMAREKARALLPDITPDADTLDLLIEAEVNKLPKTRIPARGPDGKWMAAGG